ncbi:hypothetical protein KOW79_004850 [Hemibagrus wyckioides]|uniref:Uncharacterized protein n=1 Tax=Hemibagrus wyckioides TaxID=337641 RepID=A0A9D3NX53_9TELE|nr:hypothetical protein KOW79_004850 [Hemibagrus wyckioides]
MDAGCKRVLKRIRPTRIEPKALEDVVEEMSNPPSSPEDSYAIPLPPTPPATPEFLQQLSPPRSEEPVALGHAGEGPAGMEVQKDYEGLCKTKMGSRCLWKGGSCRRGEAQESSVTALAESRPSEPFRSHFLVRDVA